MGSLCPPLKLVVGLGNPGPSYEETRHNVGVWFVDALCQEKKLKLKTEAKFNARIAETTVNGQAVLLALPNTFMNHSGQAVSAISKYLDIPVQSILIVHDELDIPAGQLRFKTDGGHGGHNGLRDIIHHLKTREFHRLRIGIGHPGNKDHVLDYVLHKPTRAEHQKIQSSLQMALQLFPLMVKGEHQTVMNQLHSFESEHE